MPEVKKNAPVDGKAGDVSKEVVSEISKADVLKAMTMDLDVNVLLSALKGAGVNVDVPTTTIIKEVVLAVVDKGNKLTISDMTAINKRVVMQAQMQANGRG